MSWGRALGVDPVHLRELAEAREERFERAREARERFGEPVVAPPSLATRSLATRSLAPGSGAPHAACPRRLVEAVEASGRAADVNRAVFPYHSETRM
jgi:hypothetical protein